MPETTIFCIFMQSYYRDHRFLGFSSSSCTFIKFLVPEFPVFLFCYFETKEMAGCRSQGRSPDFSNLLKKAVRKV